MTTTETTTDARIATGGPGATDELEATDGSGTTDGLDPSRPAGHPPSPPAIRWGRAGAAAAAVKAATYVIGFALLGAYLLPEGYADGTPAEELAFLVDHQAVLYAWHAVLYLVGGLALVVLVLAVHDRLRRHEPVVAPVAAALGLAWSTLLLATGLLALVGQTAVVDLHAADPDQAATVWASVSTVQDALGGGIELVGGAWALLVAWAGLRSGRLGRGLCRLGLVVGVAGVATVVPGTEAVAAVFGLGFVAWFTWIALELRRGSGEASA